MYDRILHNPTHEQVMELFNFEVNESPVFAVRDGQPFRIDDYKAMVTSDTNQVLGIHKSGFKAYGYKRLDEDASKLVNGDVVRKGAGLLYNRGVAFVQVGMPDSVKSRSGIEFEPFLLGTTSFNGKFATIWKNGKIVVVCRNTHAAASAKGGNEVRAKHTSKSESTLKLENVKDALGILHGIAEGEAEYIDRLCDVMVTDSQFEEFLAKLVPMSGKVPHSTSWGSTPKHSRSDTLASNKRDALWQLFQTDARCRPDHTAWSVLQTTNTYNHHIATQRGQDDREVRNMEKVINESFFHSDTQSLRMLEHVLNRELVAA